MRWPAQRMTDHLEGADEMSRASCHVPVPRLPGWRTISNFNRPFPRSWPGELSSVAGLSYERCWRVLPNRRVRSCRSELLTDDGSGESRSEGIGGAGGAVTKGFAALDERIRMVSFSLDATWRQAWRRALRDDAHA